MPKEKTTSLNLKAIPKDVHDYLLDVQTIVKKKCHCRQVSLETTIYKIVRAAKKCDIKLYE